MLHRMRFGTKSGSSRFHQKLKCFGGELSMSLSRPARSFMTDILSQQLFVRFVVLRRNQ